MFITAPSVSSGCLIPSNSTFLLVTRVGRIRRVVTTSALQLNFKIKKHDESWFYAIDEAKDWSGCPVNSCCLRN